MHGKLFWSAQVDDIDLYIIWFVEHCLIRRSLRLSLTYMLSPSLRYIDCPSSPPLQLFCHMCCCQGGLRAAMPCGIAASALKGWEISFFKVDYHRSAVTFSGLKVSSSSLGGREGGSRCLSSCTRSEQHIWRRLGCTIPHVCRPGEQPRRRFAFILTKERGAATYLFFLSPVFDAAVDLLCDVRL